MPVTRSRYALLVAILLVQACRSRQGSGEVVPLEDVGRFSFLVEARDGVRMTGWLDVTLDTIVARSESAPCRFVAEQADRTHLPYECAAPGTSGVRLLLDRRYPLRRSTWSVVTPVRRKRDVCVAFRTWENGTRTCTRTMPEEYIEQVRQAGELVVTR
jgi:hypothetical protein